MRSVQIYIEQTPDNYERFELFDDEQIVVNASIQNVQDISKVFTEFTQSFTIPASSHNNRLLHYFYETDIDIETNADGTLKWNPNYRRNAFIEVDLTPFKSGQIAIEKSNIVNNKVESYTVMFYGNIISLKDKFGKGNLKDLNITETIPYDLTNVNARIVSDSGNVLFPLISSDRKWQYGGGDDISQSATAINFTELLPALRVTKIFEAIQTFTGVTFEGNFLTSQRFTNLFLWLKNSETLNLKSKLKLFDFEKGRITSSGVSTDIGENDNTTFIKTGLNEFWVYKITGKETVKTLLSVRLNSPSSNVKVYVDVYLNDSFLQTFEGVTNTDITIVNILNGNLAGSVNKYKFYFSTELQSGVTINGYMSAYAEIPNPLGSNLINTLNYYSFIGYASQSWTADLELKSNMPDMSIEDFFTSILKTFNLTVDPISETRFKLLPLDDYYSSGAVIDITKHVDTKEIEVSKIPLYRNVNFEHEKSENFINKAFFDNNNQKSEYGDLNFTFDEIKEGELNVKVGFSDMLMSKLAGNLAVGYSIDSNMGKQVPKPLLLYKDSPIDLTIGVDNFRLTNGVTTLNVQKYVPFTQETTIGGTKYSLNFGVERRVLSPNEYLYNSLYALYYSGYITNLYNPKNRITHVETRMPISLLTNIKLKDRLIIRDKRYIINDMKINLTNNEISLNLINDFRQVINSLVPPQALSINGNTDSLSIQTPEGGSLVVDNIPEEVITPGYGDTLLLENEYIYLTEEDDYMITESASAVRFTEDSNFEFIYPSVPETTYLVDDNGDQIVDDFGLPIIVTDSSDNFISFDYVMNFSNGDTYTQPLTLYYE